MTTMVERVAEGQAGYDGRALISMPRGERERYYERARLAIAAMREPTEVMANEGWDTARAMVVPYGFRIGGETPVWQSMIDAALEEK